MQKQFDIHGYKVRTKRKTAVKKRVKYYALTKASLKPASGTTPFP